MKPEWNEFGKQCANSRWFRGEPLLIERPVRTYEQRWMCPVKPCDGEMRYNGMMWPTADPGYHHTCSKCGFTAAITGAQYPRTRIEVEKEEVI